MASSVLKNIVNKINQLAGQSITPEQIASGNYAAPAPSAPAPQPAIKTVTYTPPQPAAPRQTPQPAASAVQQAASTLAGKMVADTFNKVAVQPAVEARAQRQTASKATTTAPLVAEQPSAPTSEDIYNAYAQALAQQNSILQQQYQLRQRQRQRNLDTAISANDSAARDSLQQAYIANMRSLKNMPQSLKAGGISGGMAETVLADLNNTYMNNRNAIDRARINANNQARIAYDNGMAQDYQTYLTNQAKIAQSALDAAAKANSLPALQSLSGFYSSMGLSEQQILDRLKQLGIA